MSITIENINKTFKHTQILKDISLAVSSGEMVALLGPSGSGKTTLLRIIAGLERQDSGRIIFCDTDVSEAHARERRVGFVFQHYALFRHMNVFDNIAFGLTVLPRSERPNRARINQKVSQLLEMVQLGHLASSYPAQLSGGQKQRVALARALAVEPKILLLDEPFGALDAQVRKELRRWIRQLHEEIKFTSVFVTHDQEEAMEIADRVAVMNQGAIEQIDKPFNIMHHPKNRFVLEFIGEINRLAGEVHGTHLAMGDVQWPLPFQPLYRGRAELFLRPWEIDILDEPSGYCRAPVKVLESSLCGYYWQLLVQPLGWHSEPLTILLNNNAKLPVRGSSCYIGSQYARLYSDDNFLAPIEFAKSA